MAIGPWPHIFTRQPNTVTGGSRRSPYVTTWIDVAFAQRNSEVSQIDHKDKTLIAHSLIFMLKTCFTQGWWYTPKI